MNNSEVDIGRLALLKTQLETIGDQRKGVKMEYDQLEQHGVNMLLQLGVRYVDQSSTGAGPFWVLGKEKSDGSFNRERYNEFFIGLLGEMQGASMTPDKCSDLAMNYLKQFEKRRLVLNKLTHCRQKVVEDLIQWLATGI